MAIAKSRKILHLPRPPLLLLPLPRLVEAVLERKRAPRRVGPLPQVARIVVPLPSMGPPVEEKVRVEAVALISPPPRPTPRCTREKTARTKSTAELVARGAV